MNVLRYLREPYFVENDIDREGELIHELSSLFLVQSQAFELLRKDIALNTFSFIALIKDEFAESLNSSLTVKFIPVVTSKEKDSGKSTNVIGSAQI